MINQILQIYSTTIYIYNIYIYINVGPNLADEINTEKVDIEYDTFLKNVDVSHTMYISPTNEFEIVQIIDSLKTKVLKTYME